MTYSIISYNHHAVQYIPRTYSSCKWKCVTFLTMFTHFTYPHLHTLDNLQIVLCTFFNFIFFYSSSSPRGHSKTTTLDLDYHRRGHCRAPGLCCAFRPHLVRPTVVPCLCPPQKLRRLLTVTDSSDISRQLTINKRDSESSAVLMLWLQHPRPVRAFLGPSVNS